MRFTAERSAGRRCAAWLAAAALLFGTLGCGSALTPEDDGGTDDGVETTDDVGADGDADAPDVPGDTPDVVPDDAADVPDVEPDVPVDVPDDDAGADDAADADVPPPSELLDILFVVDNSAGMSVKQQLLADAMPAFLGALFDESETLGIDASINVGVVSTDMGTGGFVLAGCPSVAGDRGCLMHEPSSDVSGCASSYPPFLTRAVSDGTSYTVAQMADDFRCVATLGTSGCGFEQPLEAARAAVTANIVAGACNEGLIRDGSAIGLIFLSDENDCSVSPSHFEIFDPTRDDLGHLGVRCFLHADFLVPVADYAAVVTALETAGHAVFVGAIVGVPQAAAVCNGYGDELAGCLARSEMVEAISVADPARLNPSCSSAIGTASPPRRFVQLAETLGHGAYVSSICVSDYAPALTTIAGELL